MQRITIILPFLLLAAYIIGCGGGIRTEPVTGIITLDGVPLEDADVSFSPVDPNQGSPAFGRTDATGRYQLQTMLGNPDGGTTQGDYQVAITKTQTVQTGRFYPRSQANPLAEPAPIVETVHFAPRKYANTDTSGLSATVVRGRNQINFELVSD